MKTIRVVVWRGWRVLLLSCAIVVAVICFDRGRDRDQPDVGIHDDSRLGPQLLEVDHHRPVVKRDISFCNRCTTRNYANCCAYYGLCCHILQRCPAPSVIQCLRRRCDAGCTRGQWCCPSRSIHPCCANPLDDDATVINVEHGGQSGLSTTGSAPSVTTAEGEIENAPETVIVVLPTRQPRSITDDLLESSSSSSSPMSTMDLSTVHVDGRDLMDASASTAITTSDDNDEESLLTITSDIAVPTTDTTKTPSTPQYEKSYFS